MTESQSITIRIPKDLLFLIEQKAIALGGKGKRTETIISLLRKGLALPNNTSVDNAARLETFEQKLTALESNFNILSSKVNKPKDCQLTNKEFLERLAPVPTVIKKQLTTAQFTKLLRDKDKGNYRWTSENLYKYQNELTKDSWHEINDVKFKYMGVKKFPNKKNNTHYWLACWAA